MDDDRDVFRDYVGFMECDDCPASGTCYAYKKGADNKCCFGSYYYVGLCTTCALRPDGVTDMCRSLQGVLIVKSERDELCCRCGDVAGWSELGAEGVEFVCEGCFLFSGGSEWCSLDGTVQVLEECDGLS